MKYKITRNEDGVRVNPCGVPSYSKRHHAWTCKKCLKIKSKASAARQKRIMEEYRRLKKQFIENSSK